jgi:hypothetical protein
VSGRQHIISFFLCNSIPQSPNTHNVDLPAEHINPREPVQRAHHSSLLVLKGYVHGRGTPHPCHTRDERCRRNSDRGNNSRPSACTKSHHTRHMHVRGGLMAWHDMIPRTILQRCHLCCDADHSCQLEGKKRNRTNRAMTPYSNTHCSRHV